MNLSRREFLTRAAVASSLGAAATALGSASAAPAANIAPPVRPPNILYIIMEDIGPQLGCYGEPLVQTPHVDRFAAQGIRFSNAFSCAPVCSASRSALMTGCYQTSIGCHQHRTWHWNKRPLPDPTRHICDWFRAAGYFTCNLMPTADKLRNARFRLNGARGSGKLDLNFTVTSPAPGDPFDGNDWNQRRTDQPFFAHITLIETHHASGGWKVARRQPPAELVDPDRVKLAPYYPDHPVARDEYANYLDAIHLSDGYVGEMLDRLIQEGLAENTIVVLSSDHGPLFRGKQFCYDNGLRIPLIVRFPDGRKAGTVEDRLVSGIDLAPTFLGFAGITAPPGAMQGCDIFDSNVAPRTEIFAARDRMDTSIDRMRVVRTERFKYIRNYLPAIPYMQPNQYKELNYPTWNLVKRLKREGKLTPEAALFAADLKPIEELFEITADPSEVRNLAANAAHAATLKKMRSRVDAWVKNTDRGTSYEDPVDIYRGYWNHLPEDPPALKKSE
jgi:N-sulfoglucosamine sulfohydrolase